jgi:signal transduction histidine kinase
MVAADLGAQPFFCPDAREPGAKVVVAQGPGSYRHWRGAPVHRDLRDRFAMRAVLSVPLEGEEYEGRLFFLDKPRMQADDVVLSRVVAHQVGAILDNLYLQQRLQQAAVMEERVRFARDLHDGLLQSLTATALQLAAARRLLAQEPVAAQARLEEIQNVIVAEQRDLRSYIRDLRPVALLASRVSASLPATLRGLGARIERQWGLRVEVRVGELKETETAGLAHHVSHIVHEALVNAARHGGAALASVTVTETGDRVVIAVADNGRGFSFEGRYDLAGLDRMQAGPVSLKERVAALRGDLVIESTPAGARLEIGLPLATVAT